MPCTISTWFDRTVAAHGDCVALEVDDHVVTYRQLDGLVAQAARDISTASQGRLPRRIGLLSTRGLASYVGYLAVQRMGATVVPLNPIFPDERNASIIEAAQVELILAEPALAMSFTDRPVIAVREDLQPAANNPGFLLPTCGIDDFAYILFTSGSTGRPKGVPVTHRAVDSYLRHVIGRYRIGPGDRLSQTFDLTFDPSVFDLFAAWGSGATLVVPGRRDLLSPARFVNNKKITHWFSVPSIVSFASRLRGLPAGAMPGLRVSLFAGEALTSAAALAWHTAAPASIVENIYGPTELTVTCSEFRLPADVDSWPETVNGTVPIGSVYPELEYVLVSEAGRAVNDEGELCVRGSQRFTGYHDPADNLGRFFDEDKGYFTPYDGHGEVTANHWYRTGDLVGNDAGNLVHRGRLDTQLKIRGYRVELTEIEHGIRSLPGIVDAVVIPQHGIDGEIELAAVYTGEAQDPEAVRDLLGARLPAYMLPRTLDRTDQLPLNANGKIDRHAVADMLAPTEVQV